MNYYFICAKNMDDINSLSLVYNKRKKIMKKIITLILPISLLMIACSSPSTDTQTQSETAPETETTATEESTETTTETETMATEENTAMVALVSPEEEIPMGDAELILEVKDSTSGETVPVENIEVSSTMPMEGEEPMISKVEIEPTETPGQFKVKTNFGMAGTWNLAAKVKDTKYQGENEIVVEVK
ncbi:unknown [Crocosphaera subtropica ATCC 51142]|uniref:YtkA-like domain-containing protein n=2 Tax=Crocosphaera TaxID=263510 RepID=B1WYP0_CROS5|nr:unknown [Crocosphaera subtropica ATCC 51142]